jgi:large subunit ribosomal protein L15
MVNILSNLQPIIFGRKKRLGRGLGSGRGAKSGRGTTRHQKARQSIPLHFEGGQGRMVKKFPLLRGKGKNKSIKSVTVIIGIADLNIFKDGETVNAKSIISKKLIPEKQSNRRIKILANGKLEKKLIVKLSVSQSVKKIIEGIGGKVEVA